MGSRGDAVICFYDHTFGVDEVGIAHYSHVFAAKEFLFLPGAKCLDDLVFRVTEQRKIKRMLVGKFFVRSYAVFTNTYHVRISKLSNGIPGVPKVAGLFCAARRVVFGVKINHEPSPGVIFE